MIVYKVGQSLGAKSLGGVLRARWDEYREDVQRRIAKRTQRRVPLDDGDGEPALADPGEYPGDVQLDGVTIEVRALSMARVQAHTAEMAMRTKAIGESEHGDAKKAALADEEKAVRAFLSDAVMRVTGLSMGDGVEAGGAMSDELLDVLGANGLIVPVLQAADWLQSVRGDLRKNSGASLPSTSASTTATHAHPNGAQVEGVTTTHSRAAGGLE